ncbi:ABC transporter substrate-binding protein [Pseudonocardia sp. MH-G8]|uniref:ABC transporter substrate-binding protein n=1 Tax=Pseudonocardia sp. MH-G8 TaxID=1854588 RepID=UPI000BA17292|nr:ABC transporter substrate-binding protein [Pseudonocardia sp. MH-G8]OZM78120.1 LacI family transcriptional regulator [Pseudonocardia sp. MH-G8]
MMLGQFRRTRARLVAGGMVLACAFAAGCSEGDPVATDTGGGPGAEVEAIGLMVQDLSNPFFQSMANGVQAAAEELGATVNVQDGRQDLGAQNEQIDAFIQQQIDVLLINAVDSEGIGPAVDRAKEAGIRVVAVDVAARGAEAMVTLDNTAAGEIACTYLADQIGGAGEILLVNGTPISSVQDRVTGCKRALEAYPQIAIVAEQSGDNGRAEALTITTDMLTAHPDVAGVFGINDPTALGATLAAQQAGITDLVIVGVDASPEAVAELQKPDSMFRGTAAQDPNTQGAIALEMARQLFAGEPLEQESVLVPTQMITRDNLAEYEGWQ